MTPRKNSGSAPRADATPARPALAWLSARAAALRARRDPVSVKLPRRRKLHAVRPSGWSALWAARLAVRSAIPLDVFLRHRLAQHLARLPVPATRLPVTFEIDAAGVVAQPATETRRATWLESFLRAHGAASVRSDVLAGQADAARPAARIETQRRRVDELAGSFDEVTRGVDLADPADEAQAEQLGRPAVPRPLGLALQVFALLLLVAEAWPIAIPCLVAAGIDPTRLAGEARRDPLSVALGAGVAVGAAVALFLLAHFAMGRALRSAPRRPVVAGAGALGGGAIVALAWASSAVHGGADLPGVAGGYARVVTFLAAASIPFAGAWLIAAGRELERTRAAAAAVARAWDQEHYRVLAAVSRQAAELSEEQGRLTRLETERAAVVRRTNALQLRAAKAERLAADAAAEEAEELSALAQSVATALELDRYEWIRHASAHGLRAPRPELPMAAAPVPAPVRAARDAPERNLGLAG